MWGTLRKCLALLDNDKRGRWVALVFLNGLAAVVEAQSALLIFAVLGMVGGNSKLELPVIGSLQSRFPGTSSDRLLTITCLVVAVFFVFRAVVLAAQVYFQFRIAQNAGVRLSTRLLENYLRQPWTFHASTNSSVLIRNAIDSVQSVVGSTFVPLISIFADVVVMIGILAALVVASPTATLVGGISMIAIVWLSQRAVRPRLTAQGEIVLETGASSYHALQQSLQGVREVKLFGRERYFVNVFATSRARMARAQFTNAALSNAPRVSLETLFVLGLLGFLASVGTGQQVKDTLALFGLFAYAVLRLLPAVNRVALALGTLRFGGPSVDILVAELQRMEAEVDPVVAPAGEPRPLRQSIRFEEVSYRYPGTDRDVLSAIDLEIQQGEFIGIAGTTGSGKSTMLDLLVGLLEPTSGRILLDGRPLQDDLPAWHQQLGVVSQAPYLLDDTLRRNIAFGLDDAEIDDQRISEVVEAARLQELVDQLPEGLDTAVGERGARISGGQRQRLAIARALYHDPSVIVFDEGTSALDTVTETQVMAALESLRAHRTIVAVAHRLTTLRRCTRIVLLEDGRIVDIGTFDDLLERNPTFRSMAS